MGIDVEVHQTEVDGVPTCWVDEDGPFTAGLVFGAALWHEAALERGLSHLVEHLALHDVQTVPYLHNGQVDLMGTSFFFRGEPSEAVEYFGGATRALADLPMARLEHEARVLGAESAARGRTPFGALCNLRWGNRGPGLLDSPEYALRTVTPDKVEAWRLDRFGHTNAALWCSGPPPAGLDLSALPSATPHRPPLPEPIEATPGYDGADVARFTGFVVSRRDVAAPPAAGLLEQWLTDHVRHGAGSAYSVSVEYQPVAADEAFVAWSIDGPPNELHETLRVMWEALALLHREGFAPAALDLYRERLRRGMATDRTGLAATAATNLVLGREDATSVGWMDEVAALEVGEVTAVALQWLRDAQWLLPYDAQPPLEAGLLPIPLRWKDSPVAGRALARHPTNPERYDVLVGDEGLSLRYIGDTCFTVRFDSLAVCRRYDSGLRLLYDLDGSVIAFDPERWAESPDLGRWIDARAGDALVPMGPPPNR